jgi:hypothetical protein
LPSVAIPRTLNLAVQQMESMMRRVGSRKALMSVAAGVSLASLSFVAMAERPDRYARMAPVSAYLMNPAREIQLAKSAAPGVISSHATVLVLTPTGYKTAVKGTNGFLCWVVRSFAGAPDFPERWNPKIRAAECLNPPAAQSVAPIVQLRTSSMLAGRTDAATDDLIAAALKSHAIPPLQPGAVSYMMSKQSYLQDEGEHDMAHVMFFIPVSDGASWAANERNSPFIGGNYWYFTPGHDEALAKLPPMSVFITRVANWSDGTPAGHKM